MTMAEMAIYAKVFGLGINENGEPDYAGIKIRLGNVPEDKVVPYEELCESLNMNAFANMLGGKIEAKDITIISPEEYYKDYGDDDDEGEDWGGEDGDWE